MNAVYGWEMEVAWACRTDRCWVEEVGVEGRGWLGLDISWDCGGLRSGRSCTIAEGSTEGVAAIRSICL